ncbi:uncharacterized protein ColSpa_12673 [Colletotrichum spaethianum]|uniref:WD-like domain-containing protein n=1 Tax=Colletotrichum spaethianum TaxID=700344 RepID=A0AA37PHV0_9PEZI|nr:uncharacterized protein ColSpa_12673 [Colletotrichum spaethianum]GKT52492.1 hypothetical protein ColSpa_12673 [Colletotrichum spaethianum]
MLLLQQSVLVAAFAAGLTNAIPTTKRAPESLVVLEQFETEFGTATWYGDAEDSPISKRAPENEATSLNRRCGSNAVTCSGSHQGPASACAQLIVSIAGPRSGQSVPSSPRSFCLTGSGGNCCVSWANPLSNAYYSQLVPAAQKVNNQCQSGGWVSGLSRDTLIGNTCTTQCLSDRPNGCS